MRKPQQIACKQAHWLKAIVLLLIGLATWPVQTFAADAKRPNVLFLFTDDHAAHAMSCYGSKINQTPNLDRIAQGGMRFQNCFATNSLCGPSRAVIQTGKYSHLNGFLQNGDKFDGSQQTFPKLLRKVGYQTAIVGKWHLATTPTGFDYSEVLIGQGPYYNPPMLKNGQRTKHVGYTTDIITDLALDWLKNQRDQDKPFMLMCQHKAPHRNWQPDAKHLTMYDDVTLPEPDNLFDDYETRGTAAHSQKMEVAKALTPNDLKLIPPRTHAGTTHPLERRLRPEERSLQKSQPHGERSRALEISTLYERLSALRGGGR